MPNQNASNVEEQKRKKEQLDSILDAALNDLEDSDESDQEESDMSSSKDPAVSKTLAANNPNPTSIRNKEFEKQENKPPSQNKENNGITHNDAADSFQDLDEKKLEQELEKMMQHLLLGGKESGANGPGLNSIDELFSEKALEGLIEQIEKQQKINEQGAKKSSVEKIDSAPKQQQTPSSLETNAKVKNKKLSGSPEKKTSSSSKKTETAPSDITGETDVDRTVAKLLSDMAKGAGEASEPGLNMEPGNIEEMGEEIMENMMKEFEKIGRKGDTDDVIDGMMKQLLSKDIMYEPMKKVMDKFPRWLAENKASLSEQDYNRYGHQYQYFQRIVAVYEREPDNFPRLMELMQDIQEFGQPPADIIKELAPELEFDEEGMPKMDMGMGLPGVGMPGMPPLAGNENCTIM